MMSPMCLIAKPANADKVKTYRDRQKVVKTSNLQAFYQPRDVFSTHRHRIPSLRSAFAMAAARESTPSFA